MGGDGVAAPYTSQRGGLLSEHPLDCGPMGISIREGHELGGYGKAGSNSLPEAACGGVDQEAHALAGAPEGH